LDETEIEEERRLCYVGITRARERLFLSNAETRVIYGKTSVNPPSRFLSELPKELLARENLPLPKKTMPEARPGREKLFYAPPAARAMPTPPAAPALIFAAGEKVSHPKFGTGTVVQAKADGAFQEVSVAFPGGGIKKLSTKYAPLARV
jgi:DNA helicase-2/ATP-dependent DNA helicase PcrA